MTEQQNKTKITSRLINDLKSDKKKTAVLCILAIVALVLVLKTTLKKGSPTQVRTLAAAQNTQGENSDNTRISSSSREIARALSQNKDHHKNRPKIERDIFNPNPEYFPPRVRRDTSTDVQQKENPNQQQQRLDAHRQTILAQARALSLQSTVVSKEPTAIINGKVLCKGDWISGFKVVEITARNCELTKEGVTIILTMKNR